LSEQTEKLKIASAIVLGFGVAFVVGELFARVALKQFIVYDVEMTRYANELKVQSPWGASVHAPGRKAHLMGVDVSINADGLRDREFPTARGNARRWIFLGDSLTFGWGVPVDKTFKHHLETRMNQSTPTEVLNFGIGNYNTEMELRLFENRGLPYHPDAVAAFYFINDAEPTPVEDSSRSRLGESRLITLVWSSVRLLKSRIAPTASFAHYYKSLYGDDQAGWQATQRSFRALKKLCDANSVDLKVIILPELHQLHPYPFKEQHLKIARFLDENGISNFDLLSKLDYSGDPRALWVARDDAHPNVRAHALIAEASFDYLIHSGGISHGVP